MNSGVYMDSIVDINILDQLSDDAITDSNVLSKINDVIATKELSQESIKISMIAIESIYDRLGMEYSHTVSVEGIGEDIKDKIIMIWKAIKKAFAKMWELILNFFDGYLTGLEGIKRYNERVKAKLKGFNVPEDAPKTFKDNLLSVAFASVGKSFFGRAVGPTNVHAREIMDNHLNVTRHVMLGFTVLEPFIKGLSKPGLFDKNKIKDVGDDYYAKVTIKNRGDHPILLIYGLTLDLVRTHDIGFVSLDILSRTGNIHASQRQYSHEVLMLSDQEIKKLSGQVDELLKLSDDFKKDLPKYKSLNKEFNAIIDGMLSYVYKNDTSIESIDARSMEYSFKAIKNIAYKTIVVLPKINLQACKMSIRYIDQCIQHASA